MTDEGRQERVPDDEFATPATPKTAPEYTDGRRLWEWESHFPQKARQQINFEARVLGVVLVLTLAAASLCLGVVDDGTHRIPLGSVEIRVSFRLLAIFFTGCVGGATFSIKWLMHSVAKGKWHLDRRYWRFLVPVIGGVYACVVMTLFGAGLFAPRPDAQVAALPGTAALAFLVGYFSDGVSGLLSNVANAVFGTLEKK